MFRAIARSGNWIFTKGDSSVRDLNELQKLAEQGHDESQFMLGYILSRGQGVAKDVFKAKDWLERAAMANNPRAQYYLGELYGEMGKNDPRAAYERMAFWWGKSGSHPYWETAEGLDGRAVSKRRLAWLHMHSGYDNASPEEALRLLEELTGKFSSPRSAIELGIVCAVGSFAPLSKRLGGVPIQRDKENGFRLIERGVLIIENDKNDIDYNLYNAIGDVYLARDGDGPRTPEALQKAIQYKTKAVERASGVNDGFAVSLRSELAALEHELSNYTPPPSSIPVEEHYEATDTATAASMAASSEISAKFERFHEYFDSLDMDGKRDFISNLDQKLQANPNPEYQAFLAECIAKYGAANRDVRMNRPPAAPAPALEPMGQPPEPYFESAHGDTFQQPAPYVDNQMDAVHPVAHSHEEYYDPHGYDASSQEGYVQEEYQDYHQQYGDYDTVSYTDRIHSFGVSTTFVFGALLYTIGGLLLPISIWLMVNHPRGILGYGMMGVLSVLPILPIAAIWMIYMASKSPRAPEKSLTSLTLFRVTFFIHLGVIMAAAASIALLFGADPEALFGLNFSERPLDLVIILAALAVIVLYVTFFYGSLFSIVKGIRDGIYSNMFEALPGIGPFSVISYILNILVILGALVIILVGVAPDILPFALPESVYEYIERWFENTTLTLALIAFALILSRAGILLFTNVVNQFNNGLEEE